MLREACSRSIAIYKQTLHRFVLQTSQAYKARPKDDDDVFILEGTNSIALSDSDKKKIQSRLPLKIK